MHMRVRHCPPDRSTNPGEFLLLILRPLFLQTCSPYTDLNTLVRVSHSKWITYNCGLTSSPWVAHLSYWIRNLRSVGNRSRRDHTSQCLAFFSVFAPDRDPDRPINRKRFPRERWRRWPTDSTRDLSEQDPGVYRVGILWHNLRVVTTLFAGGLLTEACCV